jgi:hypothetical protein
VREGFSSVFLLDVVDGYDGVYTFKMSGKFEI